MVKVPGVDSFQCLNLAFGVVRTALEKFIESGGQLYWKDGSGPLGLVDIFSCFSHNLSTSYSTIF